MIALDSKAIQITATSLELDADLPKEEWWDLGEQLGQIERSTRWWIGDWLMFGEEQSQWEIRLSYREAERVTGLAHGTLMNIRYICGAIAPERRRKELGFWVHNPVAVLSPADQILWLDRAVQQRWTKAELIRAIKGQDQPRTWKRDLSGLLRHACRVAEWQPGKGYLIPEAVFELLAEETGVALDEVA